MPEPIIKEIKTVEYFDSRKYKFTFLDNTTRYITSVTTKLEEYREQGIEYYRERVGAEEANRALEEGGEWGGIVHHACFLLATGGAVLFEPPAYKTVGIENAAVAEIVKQNALIRQQLTLQKIPFLTISDQFRYLQCVKFKRWMDVVEPEVLYAETVVYDIELDIAGRMDFLFRVKGGNYPIAGAKDIYLPKGIILPDVKSGYWSKKYFLQLGAYRKAVKKSLGIEVEATVGIHLKAQTNTGLNTLVHLADEADHDFELYQHVAAIYDEKHKNDTPTDFEFDSVLLGNQAHGAIMLGTILENQSSSALLTKQLQESVEAVNAGKEVETTAQQESLGLGEAEAPKTATKQPISGGEFLHKRGKRGGGN